MDQPTTTIVTSYFAQHIIELGWLVYPLIALLVFLEGEAVIYSVMFLSYQGVLNIYTAVLVICLAILLTDLSSYAIGSYGQNIFPRVARFYERLVRPIDKQLTKMSFTVFLISKFTYGLHRAVMIRSGMLHLDFKKFFKIDLITSGLWMLIISALAYGSWRSVHHLRQSLKYIEVTLVVGVILLLLSSHLVAYFSKRELLADKK